MGDVASGVATSARLDDQPLRFAVDWVAWDSGFRACGLRPGDEIVAVDGAAVIRPDDTPALQRYVQTFFGQVSEAQGFAAAGKAAGAAVTLTVRRRAAARGWETLDLTGTLTAPQGYTNAAGRRALAPEGPDVMESDGFPDSWGGWAERITARLQSILASDGRRTFVSQYEYKSLQDEQAARIALLAQKYPGPFARAMQADFAAASAYAAGEVVTLPPDALEFRRRGEELAAEVRAAGAAAWAACQERLKDSLIAPFPAPHPIREGMTDRAGKHVQLPPLGNGDYVADTGRTWFAAGSDGDGWYFIDAEAPAAQAVLLAQRRYARRVTPDIAARWEYIGRILPEPRLGMVGGQAHFGFQLEPVAALVGDGAMGIDLAAPGADGAGAFAGEAALRTSIVALPPDDASPSAVLAALVQTIKEDDLDGWRALFADWWVDRLEDGRPVVYPHAIRIDDSRFEESRRSMLGRVLDARPKWESEPRIVTDGSLFPGALRIEEVDVELDHIGQFDGVTRSFNDVTVNRWWKLSRVDGGPWRIADAQSI